MLWVKGWLETRWRFVLMLGIALVTLLMGEQGDGIQTVEHTRTLANLQWVVSILAAIQLAGAGIRTQSPFRAKAGLHGSTQYTLSLPVSRSRLLAVRALVGFMETAGVVAFMFVCAWTLFPLVRGNSTPADLVKLLLASVTCVLCFYFVSLTIATVWDKMWQIYGSYFLVGNLLDGKREHPNSPFGERFQPLDSCISSSYARFAMASNGRFARYIGPVISHSPGGRQQLRVLTLTV
jgi:hypothetical protein